MIDSDDTISSRESFESPHDPFCVAAGLLLNDRKLILPLLGILSLSAIAQGVLAPEAGVGLAALLVFDRLLQLGVVSFLVLRWRANLEHVHGKMTRPVVAVGRIMLVGLAVWGALSLPMVGATIFSSPAMMTLAIFTFYLAVFWIFRFYFYFATFAFVGGSFRDVCRRTIALGRRNPTAPIKSLVAPIAMTCLAIGLLSLPSPDGRSLFWATATSAAEGVFWLLSTYTGLGFALLLLDDSEWRSAGLDPYRSDRLRTLEAQGRASRWNVLSPKNGIKVFVVAVLLILSSFGQAFLSPPAASVKVERCEARNHGVVVELELVDEQYNFRGLNPYAFSLASQTGTQQVSTGLSRVVQLPGETPLSGGIPKQSGPIKVRLEFTSNKTAESLASLDNMYLWYHMKPLMPVKASQTPVG